MHIEKKMSNQSTSLSFMRCSDELIEQLSDPIEMIWHFGNSVEACLLPKVDLISFFVSVLLFLKYTIKSTYETYITGNNTLGSLIDQTSSILQASMKFLLMWP